MRIVSEIAETNENHLSRDDASGWEDLGYGLLFLLIGVLEVMFFIGLCRNGLWSLILLVGFAWMTAPLMLVMGWVGLSNAVNSFRSWLAGR